MHVNNHTPEAKPELFYPDVEQLDADGHPLPVIPGNRVDGLHLIRKSKAGRQELCVTDQSQELWDTVNGSQQLVSEQKWFGQYQDGVDWLVPTSTVTIDARVDGVIVGTRTLTQFGGELIVESPWVPKFTNSQADKQTSTFSMPNKTVRQVWWVKRYKFSDEGEGVFRSNYNHDDYTGNKTDTIIEDTPEYEVREIVFEPMGVADELIVDPYLVVDEQSTYIDITGSNYVARQWSDNAAPYYIYLYTNGTRQVDSWFSLFVSAARYGLHYSSVNTLKVVGNSSTRVMLQHTGNYRNSSSAELTGSTSVIHTIAYYPDRLIMDIEWVVGSSITIDTDDDNSLFGSNNNGSTNSDEYYESAGSEVAGATGVYNSAKYLVTKADELNAQLILLRDTTGLVQQRILDTDAAMFSFTGQTIPSGTHRITMCMVIDSTSAYTLANRGVMGTQYKDIATANLPTISTGSAVTDLNIPDTIGTAGAASDGAIHIDLDATDHNAQITLNQDQINQAVMLHTPSIRTGAVGSEVEHLKFYSKMESVTDGHSPEVGSGTATVGGVPTLVDGIRGDAVQFDASTEYIDYPLINNANASKGTISFRMKATTAWGSGNYDLFGHASSSANTFLCYYAGGSDSGRLYWRIQDNANNLHYVYATGMQTIIADQNWHDIELQWDDSEPIFGSNFMSIMVDGIPQTTGVSGQADWSADRVVLTSAYIRLGSMYAYTPQVIIEDFLIYNAPILPFGTFLPANHSVSSAYNDVSGDIVFYWNGSDCTASNVQIGGVQGTLGASNTGSTTSFPTTGGPGGSGYFDNESLSAGYWISFPVTNGDLLDLAKGRMGFWFNPAQVPAGVNDLIFGVGDVTDNRLELVFSDQNIKMQYETGGLIRYANVDTTVFAVDTWYWIEVAWADVVNGSITQIFVNGIEDWASGGGSFGTATNPASDVMYVGADDSGNSPCDCLIYGLTITNNHLTPCLPFVLGAGPVHIPKRTVV